MKDVRYLTRGGFGFFMLLVLSLHFIKPWINPLQHGIGEYSAGNFGVLMILAFFVLGLGFLGLSVQSVQHFESKVAGYICSILFLISSFASLMLGAFPTIPAGAPSVTSALIHNQTAPILMVCSLLGMTMYSLQLRNKRLTKLYFKRAIFLVAISWVAFLILVFTKSDFEYVGLLQRICVLSTWLWLALYSFKFT
ncbi:MAG: DUF998 domain-containing protein [Bacteroidetes bacterium]|nr:DUF998 domain-containing protein [Bacteroidota bacterium]